MAPGSESLEEEIMALVLVVGAVVLVPLTIALMVTSVTDDSSVAGATAVALARVAHGVMTAVRVVGRPQVGRPPDLARTTVADSSRIPHWSVDRTDESVDLSRDGGRATTVTIADAPGVTFTRQEDMWSVEDAHGLVTVNGRSVRGQIHLVHGDEVTIGDRSYLYSSNAGGLLRLDGTAEVGQ